MIAKNDRLDLGFHNLINFLADKRNILGKDYPQLYELIDKVKNAITDSENKRIAALKEYILTLPHNIEKFIQQFYRKGNLQEAIQSGNEIMVVCDEFYLIKKERLENI